MNALRRVTPYACLRTGAHCSNDKDVITSESCDCWCCLSLGPLFLYSIYLRPQGSKYNTRKRILTRAKITGT